MHLLFWRDTGGSRGSSDAPGKITKKFKRKDAFGHVEWSGTLNVITQWDVHPFARLDRYSGTKQNHFTHMCAYHRDIWSTEAEVRLGSQLTIGLRDSSHWSTRRIISRAERVYNWLKQNYFISCIEPLHCPHRLHLNWGDRESQWERKSSC